MDMRNDESDYKLCSPIEKSIYLSDIYKLPPFRFNDSLNENDNNI